MVGLSTFIMDDIIEEINKNEEVTIISYHIIPVDSRRTNPSQVSLPSAGEIQVS